MWLFVLSLKNTKLWYIYDMSDLKGKLKNLPKKSGVYFFRNRERKIIYVGKAVNLKNRVGSYFQRVEDKDIKTRKLVSNILDVEWVETNSEIGALILESEMIKRYKPKYNIELKDDKNFVYLKIPKEDFPLPTVVRDAATDKDYFIGPFTDARAVRRVLKSLRKIFPYRSPGDLTAKKPCFYFHLGQCPGVCIGKINKTDYNKNIRGIKSFFEGKSEILARNLKKEMLKHSKNKDFEKAANIRDQIKDLENIGRLKVLEEEDFGKADKALLYLQKKLNLENVPSRIECYDISNIQGQEAVGSMIVFKDGFPSRDSYRKFKIAGLNEPNDYAMLEEVLTRRFRKTKQLGHLRGEKNSWDNLPDLIIIDGGKGQLGVGIKVLRDFNIVIPTISLAKKNEEVFQKIWDDTFKSFKIKKINIQDNSEASYLLQRMRDEAHRFAITYFRNLHQKNIKKSVLDEIAGIGPKTKKKLIRQFGSIAGIKGATKDDLEKLIGKKLAVKIKEEL